MKQQTTKEITRKESYYTRVVCDLCNKEAECPDGSSFEESDWSERHNPYQVATTSVVMHEGSRYPEGANIEITTVDICTNCFETKLLPWLRGQGVEAQIREEME